MIPKIFIVEGPDNCGKSTLAKEIAKRVGGNYWHMTSGPGLDDHRAMSRYQLDALKNAEINLELGNTTVFDRHWPSDQVYGLELRDRPSLDFDQMMMESMRLRIVFVFCHRHNAVKEHEKNQDPDHPYDSESYARIVDGYRDLHRLMEVEIPDARVVGYHLDNFIGRPSQLDAFITGLKGL